MADQLTVGVEEEFLLVDSSGHLAAMGPEVVHDSADPAGELQEELTRSQVESATPVCHGGEELLAQLRKLRTSLIEEAASRGLRLLPSGTPLLTESGPAGITPRPRYRRMARHFGAIADTGTMCGCHVHVGISDRATGVEISNRLRPWLPVLLALTANSPYNEGADTGYASWRHVLWSRWPSAGPPPLFTSLDHYDDSVGAMLDVGAILDHGMVYWDIRPSAKRPTLEFRVSDVAATAAEAATLAIVVRGLVAVALRDLEAGRPVPALPPEVLRARLWRAARDGLGGKCPHPVTGGLVVGRDLPGLVVEHLRPVLPPADLEFAGTRLAALARHGGGAQRQRAAFAERHRITDVIDLLVHTAGR
ncbi:carboxylate-amine ligase [Amycolatopsis arida]|uniref:Putative glutamate--cysteine ligase 2 n=1 Tax=Amycolatopsis arida TaxID=587909 RepID=A0A1I5ZRU6_9PSEU|nr:glutamate--cysteine ligase [Amycolatopsis arida]TDX89326.1 carboxylate-amine ligase [Amycolatopsis arida]SFQ59196.1 carboxylate-amine ligase [Amycolatopsis arida]